MESFLKKKVLKEVGEKLAKIEVSFSGGETLKIDNMNIGLNYFYFSFLFYFIFIFNIGNLELGSV